MDAMQKDIRQFVFADVNVYVWTGPEAACNQTSPKQRRLMHSGVTGLPRALGGPGAKLGNEAPCERSGRNVFDNAT